jgi:hypothetical protein
MRYATSTLALAWLGALWLGGSEARADAPDVAADLRATADLVLAGGSQGAADVHQALRHLVEITARVGRDGKLPAPVQAKLDAARTQTRSLSPLDDRARTALDEAYAALNRGQAFAFPRTVGSIEEAKAYGRGQVDRSLAALRAGPPEEAARELMGFILLVVTPMERHP